MLGRKKVGFGQLILNIWLAVFLETDSSFGCFKVLSHCYFLAFRINDIVFLSVRSPAEGIAEEPSFVVIPYFFAISGSALTRALSFSRLSTLRDPCVLEVAGDSGPFPAGTAFRAPLGTVDPADESAYAALANC